MIAKPKIREWWRNGRMREEIETIPASEGVWIECEIYSPSSAVGRTVEVYFPPETITMALLLFRDAARDMRKGAREEEREASEALPGVQG